MKRSSSASSASDSSDSDSDSAAENKKKREELAEEDLWQHLTYWTLEEEEEDSEQVMDQDNGRVFAKIYAVDAENGATTEQLIELFDPFFTTDNDGGVTDSELMMVCLDLVSGSL